MKKALLLLPLVLAGHSLPASAWWMTTYKCEEFRYRTEVIHPILFGNKASTGRIATSWPIRTWTVQRRYEGETYQLDTGRGRMATCVHQGSTCGGSNGFYACN